MKTARNPFSSGGPVEGEYFGDRVRETRDLVRAMTTDQNVFLMSPRRYGKTSLLRRAAAIARKDHEARVALANLQWAASRQEVAEEITRAVVEGVAGKGKQRLGVVSEFLSHLPGARVSLSGAGTDADLSIALAPPAGGEHSFLQEIKLPVAEMARAAKGHPVCLVVDEFQRAAEIDENLPAVFKGIADELGEVSLVFSGSRRHMMEEIFRGPGASLKGVAQEMAIDVIPEGDMVEFLLARSASAGKPMEPPAASRIYGLARGVPNAVQLLAKYAWYAADTTVTGDSVEAGLTDALRDQGGSFALLMSQFSANERRVMRTLAGRDWIRPFSQEFVHATGLSTPSVQYSLEALRKDEHVVRDGDGKYRIEDPIFDLWLTRGPSLERG